MVGDNFKVLALGLSQSFASLICEIFVRFLLDFISVSNHAAAPKSRLIGACFDPENQYKAVLNVRYAEKQQFRSLPGAVNTVRDTINLLPSLL